MPRLYERRWRTCVALATMSRGHAAFAAPVTDAPRDGAVRITSSTAARVMPIHPRRAPGPNGTADVRHNFMPPMRTVYPSSAHRRVP